MLNWMFKQSITTYFKCCISCAVRMQYEIVEKLKFPSLEKQSTKRRKWQDM